jgi:hypothetical protein
MSISRARAAGVSRLAKTVSDVSEMRFTIIAPLAAGINHHLAIWVRIPLTGSDDEERAQCVTLAPNAVGLLRIIYLSPGCFIKSYRLKLRCDRSFPCGSCVKRGCEAICPDVCNKSQRRNSDIDRLSGFVDDWSRKSVMINLFSLLNVTLVNICRRRYG